jgi:DNA replication and repair protein RecF
VRLRKVWLADFRNYRSAELELSSGLTVVLGGNGEGKSNLLEAVGYLATLSSFRGAPPEAMVRTGCERAVLRSEAESAGRELLLEVEITSTGRGRASLNRQPMRRGTDIQEALRATVFSPDDLELVKGGPAGRRRYLDETLVALHPRHEALRRDLERILRQRTALLRQAAGRPPPPHNAQTHHVWDAKLTSVGEALADARAELCERLRPLLDEAYRQLAEPQPPRDDPHGGTVVGAAYEAPWRAAGLAASLAEARPEELRRGVSLVGPHRDDLGLSIAAMPARTHASQGEQRTLALALRLAAHRLVASTVGQVPVLLLDDVFSELDADRGQALLAELGGGGTSSPTAGQTILTTTGRLPADVVPDDVVHVVAGELRR